MFIFLLFACSLTHIYNYVCVTMQIEYSIIPNMCACRSFYSYCIYNESNKLNYVIEMPQLMWKWLHTCCCQRYCYCRATESDKATLNCAWINGFDTSALCLFVIFSLHFPPHFIASSEFDLHSEGLTLIHRFFLFVISGY